jgi:predicted permease
MTQTTIASGLLIRPVARFVAIGLFLMAFFTTLWALWALYGLPTVAAVVLVAIFVALSVVFVINGVQLIKSIPLTRRWWPRW